MLTWSWPLVFFSMLFLLLLAPCSFSTDFFCCSVDQLVSLCIGHGRYLLFIQSAPWTLSSWTPVLSTSGWSPEPLCYRLLCRQLAVLPHELFVNCFLSSSVFCEYSVLGYFMSSNAPCGFFFLILDSNNCLSVVFFLWVTDLTETPTFQPLL